MVFAVAAGVVVVGVMVYGLVRERRRSAAVEALAAEIGFVYLGDRLPGVLELAGTEIANVSLARNVMEGERHGVRVIAFDCTVGEGKGSWRRTVVAARTSRAVFAGRAMHLAVQRAGEWTLLFAPYSGSFVGPGLMSVAELRAYVESV